MAWWHVDLDLDDASNPVSAHLAAGLLGSPESFTVTVPAGDGFLRAYGAGSNLAMLTSRAQAATLVVQDLAAGRELQRYELTTPQVGAVAIDPARSVAYVAVQRPIGGVEIRRLSLAQSASTTLITLDKRFTPDGQAIERYVMTVDPDGVLVVEACAEADGCRLWEVGPNEASAKPRTLAKGLPIVCGAIGATRDWLVVYDDATCWADTGDASLPIRAIDRRDGSSHLVDARHLLASRVIELGGRTYVLASVRTDDWSRSDIVSIDVESRAEVTHVRGLVNASSETQLGWLGVSPMPLPPPWVLLETWGVDPAVDGVPPAARLLDLTTDQVIELNPGTSGWR